MAGLLARGPEIDALRAHSLLLEHRVTPLREMSPAGQVLAATVPRLPFSRAAVRAALLRLPSEASASFALLTQFK
jgi:hypothetical protein